MTKQKRNRGSECYAEGWNAAIEAAAGMYDRRSDESMKRSAEQTTGVGTSMAIAEAGMFSQHAKAIRALLKKDTPL